MISIRKKALHWNGNQLREVMEETVEEGPLQIHVNGKSFTMTMRTPGCDVDLATGLLITEGIVTRPGDILSIEHAPPKKECDAATIWIQLGKSAKLAMLDSRSLLSSASCGICGKTKWTELKENGVTKRSSIFSFTILKIIQERTEQAQTLFHVTGGSHAAAAFDAAGQLMILKEDIGRHNAVDKVVGDLWNKRELNKAALLFVSGRVSYEIVAKAYRAGISILAAVSAPSSLAVEMCEKLGITLAGFCRGDRATIYTHKEIFKESAWEKKSLLAV